MMLPPVKHRIDDKVAGIVTCAEMDVPFVPPQVVDTVWDHDTQSMMREIMIPAEERPSRADETGTHVVAQDFPLFRVDRDDGKPSVQISLLQRRDLLKLGIAIGTFSHRLHFLRLPASEIRFVEQP